jgi:hypothetical protein
MNGYLQSIDPMLKRTHVGDELLASRAFFLDLLCVRRGEIYFSRMNDPVTYDPVMYDPVMQYFDLIRSH